MDRITLKSRYRYDDKGALCKFYSVTQRKGIKVWVRLDTAYEQYTNQIKAHKGKCAPAVMSELLPVYEKNKQIGYGFITQKARVRDVTYSNKLINDLERRYKKVFGKPYIDFHEYNVGMIGKRLVYVDLEEW